MVWAYILSFKVVFSEKIKIKILDLQNIRRSLLKSCKQSPLQRRKRVFITVMRKCLDSSALGKVCLFS